MRPALGLVLLVAVGAGCSDRDSLELNRVPSIPFSSEVWKDWNTGRQDFDVRLQMVRDLLRSHTLVGMAETDLFELLGPYNLARWDDEAPLPGYLLGHSPRTPGFFGKGGYRLALVVNVEGGQVRGVASPWGVVGVLPAGVKLLPL